jgi:hypothetical protein
VLVPAATVIAGGRKPFERRLVEGDPHLDRVPTLLVHHDVGPRPAVAHLDRRTVLPLPAGGCAARIERALRVAARQSRQGQNGQKLPLHLSSPGSGWVRPDWTGSPVRRGEPGILLTSPCRRDERGSAPVPLPVELPQDLELRQDDRLLDARGCR